ncbi:MAG: hypothetical protein E6G38_04570 [Actinobacteria bacterium]|nr:MAG: hypothetical protein E6G38_04570 [Actinomycetota bacterium]
MDGFRAVAVCCACLFLAACGGTTTRQPSIDRGLAIRLAGESDAVGAALGRGNPCLAVARARTLRFQVTAATAAGSIPTPLAADARAMSARLASTISCTQPPPAPPPAPSMCAETDAQGNPRGQGNYAREHEKDQEDSPGQQRTGCR